jgi:hypothetical protein
MAMTDFNDIVALKHRLMCFCILLLLLGNSTAFSPSSSSSSSSSSSQNRLGSRKRVHFNHKTNTPLDENIFSLHDLLPVSMFTMCCVAGALLISTYEAYDVAHVRPNPSTLRRPTTTTGLNYLRAATKGMGWGESDRMFGEELLNTFDFEEWYGSSAATLQWKPSYNEIMLQHRLERVPRWVNKERFGSKSNIMDTFNEEGLQHAVLNLYQSLDELNELKLMADNYQWDEIKDLLHPNNGKSKIRNALENSMDVLKFYLVSKRQEQDNPSTIIGFDWGSCAWRHCGAKADGQEALAELYSSVGMLEPFECRFVLGASCPRYCFKIPVHVSEIAALTQLNFLFLSFYLQISLKDRYEMFWLSSRTSFDPKRMEF